RGGAAPDAHRLAGRAGPVAVVEDRPQAGAAERVGAPDQRVRGRLLEPGAGRLIAGQRRAREVVHALVAGDDDRVGDRLGEIDHVRRRIDELARRLALDGLALDGLALDGLALDGLALDRLASLDRR